MTSPSGALPLLAPMSEVAGRNAIQAVASCLEKERGGMGMLLGGVPGVAPGKVTILGGGVVGANAALIAAGMGAQVAVIDPSLEVLRLLSQTLGTGIMTVFSTAEAIEQHMLSADLVVGAVLIPGAATPRLVSAATVKRMKPGAVPRTSTYALNEATLPLVLALAELGWREALKRDPHLRAGLNICEGKVTHRMVADALGRACADPLQGLA